MGLFSVISGIAGLGQSNKAHDIYGSGLTSGYGELQKGLDATEARVQPTAQIGTDTITNLNNILNNGDMSKFYNSPDYKYNLDQMTRGLNAQAASQGTLMSGNTLKELQKNAGGLASQNYGSYIQNMQNLFRQTDPYLQQYNNIPNIRGQNAMNFYTAMGNNSAGAHNDKANIISGIGTGLDEMMSQAASAMMGMPSMGGSGGGMNMLGSATPQQGWGQNDGGEFINTSAGTTSPWGSQLSGQGLQFGQNYGYGGQY